MALLLVGFQEEVIHFCYRESDYYHFHDRYTPDLEGVYCSLM